MKKKLTSQLKRTILDLMVKARVLEERLIKMNKAGMGFFWIGGPGEEAFNVPLGLLIRKGEGLDYDFLHFHYRQSATLLAMGMEMLDPIRQMHNVAADPYSGGRNFVSHYSIKKWNVTPVSSPIEVQYAVAIGTGVAQARQGGQGITLVTGGDAGTAEGEFASLLIWVSRKGRELPVLIIVTNNQWGISTPYEEVHGVPPIAKRGDGFGIKNTVVDGNDVEASFEALQEAMRYVRTTRKPFLLEARVSRLYGHSSASGANWVEGEEDCIVRFEKQLLKEKLIQKETLAGLKTRYEEEAKQNLKQVLSEPPPEPQTIFDHVFADSSEGREPWPQWLRSGD